jgi:hypothetical protein
MSKSIEEKTKGLERRYLPIDKLEPNPDNPNEMSEAEFNMLYDNIEKVGVTDPILCRPHPDKPGLWRIIGGEHRWQVARVAGLTEVPVTVITDSEFTQDDERFQLVRHNIIHGKMSPKKFMKLYDGLQEEYSREVAAEMFGFVEEEDFRKLIKDTAANLPKEQRKEFLDGAKEIKTIDELAALLNRLFTKHGDSLPYGYMLVDFGGKDSVWLRLSKSDKGNFMEIAGLCKERGLTVDSLFSNLLQLIASKDEGIMVGLDKALEGADKVVIPEDVEVPTLDFLNEFNNGEEDISDE